MKSMIVYLLSLALFTTSAWSQEKEAEKKEKPQPHFKYSIVVTADKLEEPIDEVSASVTLITAEQIKEKQAANLAEILPFIPGFSLAQTGSLGHLSTLHIRGAESDHNLVLINDIPVNDPASSYFDFSSLSLEDIERIEIVRGPQSTLYGSDALGGVINLITKKGEKKSKLNLNFMTGTDATYKAAFSFSSKSDRGNIYLNTSHFSTQGNFENDDYTNTTFSFRGETKIMNSSDLALFARYTRTNLGIPFSSAQNPSPSRRQTTEESLVSIPFSFSPIAFWKLKFNLSYFKRNYILEDQDDPYGFTYSFTDSQTFRLEAQSNLQYSSGILTFGGEWKDSYIDDIDNFGINFKKQKIETKAIFIQNHLYLANIFLLTAGIRLDYHNQFGAHYSPRITGAWLLKNTKLKASWGSGFRAPRPNELYNWWGNKDLKPEVSSSWEVGIEQKLLDPQLAIGLTHFSTDIKDVIVYDYTSWKLKNLAQSQLYGQEFTLHFVPYKTIILQANYTHLIARDKKESTDLLRRPRHNFNFNFSFKPYERIKLNVSLIYVGRRRDYNEITISTVDNPPFNRVDFSLRWQLKDMIYLVSKISNLLDKKYQEVYGYLSPDRGAYCGIELNFSH